MPHKLKIKTDCTYFHKGYDRKDYAKGEEVETDDDEFAAVALEQGWAQKPTSGKKAKPESTADEGNAGEELGAQETHAEDTPTDNPDPAAVE